MELVREATPNLTLSALKLVTRRDSTWQEGDDLLSNASQMAIIQHLIGGTKETLNN